MLSFLTRALARTRGISRRASARERCRRWPSLVGRWPPVKTGLRPPPTAAAVLTGGQRPTLVCHQDNDAGDRWRAPIRGAAFLSESGFIFVSAEACGSLTRWRAASH